MEIIKKKALARQGILLRRWLLARTPTAAKKTLYIFFFLSIISLENILKAQNWQQIGQINRGMNSLFADTINSLLYFGGGFKFNNDIDTLNGIGYWDGNKVHKMRRGREGVCGNNSCHDGMFISGYRGDIIVGMTGKKMEGKVVNGIAQWGGEAWSALGEGFEAKVDSPSWSAWSGGSCVQDDKLYVAGNFRTAGKDTCNSIAYWDGANWHSLGFPADTFDGQAPFNGSCVFYKGELYVGGNCANNIGGYFNRGIARYDGQKWKRVGQGLKGGYTDIRDMVVYKDELYVCGYFRKDEGNVGNKIMRWDGVQWKPVGGGLCGGGDIPTQMLIHGGKLYLVGIFDCVDGDLPASNIAVWDGERWCSCGNSIFNNTVSDIAFYNNDLYVGGGFTEIDGQPAKYFAKWVGDHSTDSCSAPISSASEPLPAALRLSPNPASEQFTITLTGSKPVGLLRVVNALGTTVREVSVSGSQTTVSTADLPAGVYVVQHMEEGAVRAVGRVVVQR